MPPKAVVVLTRYRTATATFAYTQVNKLAEVLKSKVGHIYRGHIRPAVAYIPE
jgi:hypothetical protein